jgi:hypothetical protein
MTRLLILSATLALLPSLARAEDNVPPKGFTALFNGKDLTGWHGMPHFDPYKLEAMPPGDRTAQIEKWTEDAKKHWSVQSGDLVNDGNGAYLTTDKEYENYELLIDYKTVAKADSGIYLRNTPQVQIWDYTKEGGKWNLGADKGSGGLWNNSPGAPGKDPLVLADKPFGEWNTFRIIQIGARTTVFLNDKLVVENAAMENFWDNQSKPKKGLPLKRKGSIQLQTHGGEIRWKNVFLREIGPDEANEILSKADAKGFEKVFNGKDFDGWQGATADHEVKDGAIVVKKGKGGNLYTKESYKDFVARLEYRLPKGGNNGLAIRYPGTGTPSQTGMCEIQILDDEDAKYAKLDARQYNGSAYGAIAPHRGYGRPVGEWNFMEVTVKGHTIKIELNGTKILEGDLSKVTDFKDGKAHEGLMKTEGFFGFAGHNDPVEFRNVWIKKLN